MRNFTSKVLGKYTDKSIYTKRLGPLIYSCLLLFSSTVSFASPISGITAYPLSVERGNSVVANGATVKIKTSLYVGASTTAIDANVVVFDLAYSNAVDINDAKKLLNGFENMGILRNNDLLIVETRQPISNDDSIPYYFTNLQKLTYRLEFTPSNIFLPGQVVVLKDKYRLVDTLLDLSAPVSINFTVDANTGSFATDRFLLIFNPSIALPVTFVSISANIKKNAVQVDWKVAGETAILNYEIERSSDGSLFTKVGIVSAKGRTDYNWLDESPYPGTSYYRIKSISVDGVEKFTNIAKVFLGGVKSSFTISPNPVQGSEIKLQFSNQPKGKYEINLVDAGGRVVYRSFTEHAGGNSTHSIRLPIGLNQNAYQLLITTPLNTKTVKKIIISTIK